MNRVNSGNGYGHDDSTIYIISRHQSPSYLMFNVLFLFLSFFLNFKLFFTISGGSTPANLPGGTAAYKSRMLVTPAHDHSGGLTVRLTGRQPRARKF